MDDLDEILVAFGESYEWPMQYMNSDAPPAHQQHDARMKLLAEAKAAVQAHINRQVAQPPAPTTEAEHQPCYGPASIANCAICSVKHSNVSSPKNSDREASQSPADGMGEVELVERLAHFEHESWSRWMLWLYDTWENGTWNDDGSYTIKPHKARRWLELAKTPYKGLDEPTKKYDRDEVAHIMPLITQREQASYVRGIKTASEAHKDGQKNAYERAKAVGEYKLELAVQAARRETANEAVRIVGEAGSYGRAVVELDKFYYRLTPKQPEENQA